MLFQKNMRQTVSAGRDLIFLLLKVSLVFCAVLIVMCILFVGALAYLPYEISRDRHIFMTDLAYWIMVVLHQAKRRHGDLAEGWMTLSEIVAVLQAEIPSKNLAADCAVVLSGLVRENFVESSVVPRSFIENIDDIAPGSTFVNAYRTTTDVIRFRNIKTEATSFAKIATAVGT
ncbi:MAG: hypothetical protein WC819_06680 [Parcubacteria group bacterium]|jgi:hypothetical protein